VYLSSHPDDWQLFMNPNAFNDVKADYKTIFIHTTAGDAGSGTGRNNYYLARQEGSLRAIRFTVNAATGRKGSIDMNEEVIKINGHDILKCSYGNAVAIFLRFPDGGPGGNGYELHDFESLKRFYEGLEPQFSTIDGSTTYTSKQDFIETMAELFNSESAASDSIIFNLPDTDMTINAGDHTDHQYGSKFFQDVADKLPKTAVNLYLGYITQEKEANIAPEDFPIVVGTWGATTSGLADNFHPSTWDNTHNAWLDTQYVRRKPKSNQGLKSSAMPCFRIINETLFIGEQIRFEIKSNPSEAMNVLLYDSEGKRWFRKEITAADLPFIEIPTMGLRSGRYSVIVGTEGCYQENSVNLK
jgi:hypothetical protein